MCQKEDFIAYKVFSVLDWKSSQCSSCCSEKYFQIFVSFDWKRKEKINYGRDSERTAGFCCGSWYVISSSLYLLGEFLLIWFCDFCGFLWEFREVEVKISTEIGDESKRGEAAGLWTVKFCGFQEVISSFSHCRMTPAPVALFLHVFLYLAVEKWVNYHVG